MTALLRFWRSLPALAGGLAILVESCLILFPGIGLEELKFLVRGLRDVLGEAVTGILLGVAAITLAGLGAELGRVVLLPTRQLIQALFQRYSTSQEGPSAGSLRVLVQTPRSVAARLFQRHSAWISDLYKSTSLASAESKDMFHLIEEKWANVFALVKKVVEAEEGPAEIWRLTYFTNVTQEQAIADYELVRMEAIQLTWLALALTPFAAGRFVDGFDLLWANLGILGVAVLLIPTYISRKNRYSVYILYSLIMGGQFGKLAEVSDREAE